ncbi:hypothetical protein DSO57_1025925 [Entomophthora muscae]|uniref:Uncharacterized protein n=1 Tax=Entomophthora muscae TaxID=34485 RepID=A0ACC2TP82_9FUNG|nr:hypothetical protein DSO57_1025925 [Entomophthora muscae]
MKISVLVAGAWAGLTKELAVAFNARRHHVGVWNMRPSVELEAALSACSKLPLTSACDTISQLACSQRKAVNGFSKYNATVVRLCGYETGDQAIGSMLGPAKGSDMVYSYGEFGCEPANIVAGVKRENDVYMAVSYDAQHGTPSLNPVYFSAPNCHVVGMEQYVVPNEDHAWYRLYMEVNFHRAAASLPAFKYSSLISSYAATQGSVSPDDLRCSRFYHPTCRNLDSTGCDMVEVKSFKYPSLNQLEKIGQAFAKDSHQYHALVEPYHSNQYLMLGFSKDTRNIYIWAAYGIKCQRLCKPNPLFTFKMQ